MFGYDAEYNKILKFSNYAAAFSPPRLGLLNERNDFEKTEFFGKPWREGGGGAKR